MRALNIEKLYDVIVNSIKVSKLNVSKEEFKTFIKTIDYINSLPRLSRRVGENSLDQYLLCSVFKDFIYPDSVTLNCEFDDRDFLVRPEAEGDFMLPNEFIQIQNVIMNALRFTQPLSDWDNVADIRKTSGKSLSTISDQAAVLNDGQYYCLENSNPYIPVPICIELKDKRIYSCPADDMILKCFIRRLVG